MNERQHSYRLLVVCLFLALIVLLEYAEIRTLENQVNNYAEECGDRTDAPTPAPSHLEIRHAGKLACACRGDEVCACQ